MELFQDLEAEKKWYGISKSFSEFPPPFLPHNFPYTFGNLFGT
jgi:hypothetical protein